MIIENENYRLVIEEDIEAENPRVDCEPFTKMFCFHKRYNIGDKHNYNSNDFKSFDELKKAIIKDEKSVIILPVYLYDHSGLVLSTSSFNDRFDSGQVGFIFANCETVRELYNVKRISPKLRKDIIKLMGGEIEAYNQYLAGETYFYELTNKNGDNDYNDGGCYGFYGSNFWTNGMYDYVDAEVVISLYPELKKEFGENKFIEGKIKELVIQ